MKLSVIVPFYNVAPWFERCLYSILHIDLPFNEFEIIAVDDGSTDSSTEILNKYIDSHQCLVDAPSFVVVKQENRGLSAARNVGLQQAKGDYVWFVDSDDDIDGKDLKMVLDFAIEQRLDVLCFDIRVIKQGQPIITYPNHKNKCRKIFEGQDFFVNVAMPPSSCVALYRKDYLISNCLCFKEGIVHEDQEFTPRAYCLAKRISYINAPAYNYWVRSGSIMTSTEKRAKKAKDLLVICDSLYQFTNEHIEKGTAAYSTMIGKINFAFSQSLRNYTKGVSTISEYKSKPYYPLDISVEGERRVRWKYRLINFSIPLYLLVHRMLKR